MSVHRLSHRSDDLGSSIDYFRSARKSASSFMSAHRQRPSLLDRELQPNPSDRARLSSRGVWASPDSRRSSIQSLQDSQQQIPDNGFPVRLDQVYFQTQEEYEQWSTAIKPSKIVNRDLDGVSTIKHTHSANRLV